MTAGRKNADALSTHWGTPHKYVDAVRRAFGGVIHLDPCSNEWSIVRAETEWSLPGSDGLREQWRFRTIYVNPPYGADQERGTRIADWLEKCAEAHDVFGAEVIALVPVAANTMHWKKSVWARATSVCFLYDTRVKFLENGRSGGLGAPMACAVVYWGQKPGDFAEAFSSHGAVVQLSHVSLPEGKHARQTSFELVVPERRFG